MKRVKIIVSALAIIATSVLGSYAADDLVIPASQEDAYVPVEVGSGWYIRGDVGYVLGSSTSGTYRTFGDQDPDPLVTAMGYSTLNYDRFNFDTTREISGGVGYRLNSYIRGDITGALWKRNVVGTDLDLGYTDSAGDLFICGDNTNPTYPTAVACRSTDTTRVSAIEIMANAYVDLGTYAGFTPYVGAGVGLTRLKFTSLRNSSVCIDASGNQITGCSGPTATHAGLDSTRLTFALMAGAAYDLTKNLKLDLGYRYSRVKGGDMFNFDAASAAVGATGVQGKHSDLSSHQLKAGLRYEIW